MYSASSPLPVLLLSNVVGYIDKGFYLLLSAGPLQGPSPLRQYLGEKKSVCRYGQQKLRHSRATKTFLITISLSLLE